MSQAFLTSPLWRAGVQSQPRSTNSRGSGAGKVLDGTNSRAVYGLVVRQAAFGNRRGMGSRDQYRSQRGFETVSDDEIRKGQSRPDRLTERHTPRVGTSSFGSSTGGKYDSSMFNG